ncbi:HIT family protein [Chryseobacterium pennipullorum]|uniref:HIT family protein n=1 Tax=Chryseobacterium pennipullorum TaxID=2258963 RepID=A0A3D9B2D4_9FLAO|nr:HIT family protein [Chryseobacterium pennipullorum]REC47507.1 HIT family protein [Chryseobacterium pennipullorum]
MTDCIFCRIINRELPASIVHEDDHIIAFMDIQPVNPGHILVVPKIHQVFISELDENLTSRMFNMASRINRAIRKSEVQCEGINYFLADGEAAGQEVFHTHLHVFPRFTNDGFGLRFDESYHSLPKRDELDELCENIRSLLK